ncbi:unnamed protein product [Soboliphyme baturini]|uniref:CHMP6 protein n=1 Tax=Soboliphyme baturini TaxID=241478 RepID=A0A183ING0_9BILA|nr:unnamed protein product [Soboliphyme baturini]
MRSLATEAMIELQLKSQRDKLKQYHRRIELNLDKERQAAVQLLKNGKKERALLLLRRKRYLEQLQERSLQQLANTERMIHDIEFTQVEISVLEGLKVGNACLAKMHEILSLDDVEKIMSETAEAVEYQREIDAAIAGGLSETDEADLQMELEQMCKV